MILASQLAIADTSVSELHGIMFQSLLLYCTVIFHIHMLLYKRYYWVYEWPININQLNNDIIIESILLANTGEMHMTLILASIVYDVCQCEHLQYIVITGGIEGAR